MFLEAKRNGHRHIVLLEFKEGWLQLKIKRYDTEHIWLVLDKAASTGVIIFIRPNLSDFTILNKKTFHTAIGNDN